MAKYKITRGTVLAFSEGDVVDAADFGAHDIARFIDLGVVEEVKAASKASAPKDQAELTDGDGNAPKDKGGK